MEEEKRDNWGSSGGFILATTGAIIGINGTFSVSAVQIKHLGGVYYLLIYLLMAVVVTFPIIIAQLALGRTGKSNIYNCYAKIDKNWRIIGYFVIFNSFISCYGLLSLMGWIIKTFIDGSSSNSEQFLNVINVSIVYIIIVLIIVGAVVAKGLSSGIEKANKFMMPLLLIFMVIMAGKSVIHQGSVEKFRFLLKPDYSMLTLSSIIPILFESFFHSLGGVLGIVIIYGSYLSKKTNLIKSSFKITVLSTIVPLLFVLVTISETDVISIFTLKSFDMISSIFLRTLSKYIFALSICIPIISTLISLLEILITFAIDHLKIKRKYAVIKVGGIVGIFAFLSHLGVNVINGKIFSLFLSINTLLFFILIGYIWKKEDVIKEITNNGEINFSLLNVWFFIIRYIAPFILVSLIIFKFLNFFKIK
ncbi:MAG: hypothetical protein ACRC0S_02415 [Fusobacteriaceae bacterium]